MSWRIEVKPNAENQYLRLDQKTLRRWRILLTPNRDARVLSVYAILPRGDAY